MEAGPEGEVIYVFPRRVRAAVLSRMVPAHHVLDTKPDTILFGSYYNEQGHFNKKLSV